MYKYVDIDSFDGRRSVYRIEDPDGGYICIVHNEEDAKMLISHLNREKNIAP